VLLRLRWLQRTGGGQLGGGGAFAQQPESLQANCCIARASAKQRQSASTGHQACCLLRKGKEPWLCGLTVAEPQTPAAEPEPGAASSFSGKGD